MAIQIAHAAELIRNLAVTPFHRTENRGDVKAMSPKPPKRWHYLAMSPLYVPFVLSYFVDGNAAQTPATVTTVTAMIDPRKSRWKACVLSWNGSSLCRARRPSRKRLATAVKTSFIPVSPTNPRAGRPRPSTSPIPGSPQTSAAHFAKSPLRVHTISLGPDHTVSSLPGPTH